MVLKPKFGEGEEMKWCPNAQWANMDLYSLHATFQNEVVDYLPSHTVSFRCNRILQGWLAPSCLPHESKTRIVPHLITSHSHEFTNPSNP